MSDYTTRYFQLTSDILIEYNYATEAGTDGKINAEDLGQNTVITNPVPYMKFYLINKNYAGINLYENNFVIPTNNSQTSFVKLLHYDGGVPVFTPPVKLNVEMKEFNYQTDGNSYALTFDKIRFHFSSGNYMKGYDGLIFQCYVYDKNKNKICLMSFNLSRKDDLTMNQDPMIINQRRYTSYIDVRIPSTYKILRSYNENPNTNSTSDSIVYNTFKTNLDILNSTKQLMVNTPLCFNVFGVKHEMETAGFTYYLTENIASISIPSKDTYGDVYVDISEAKDGDYFNIQVKISDGTSFSDYIYRMDDNPDVYVILHQIKLIEHVVTYNNSLVEKITHTQQYMVNATSSYLDEHENKVIDINTDLLDNPVSYRPVCKYGSRCFKFTIEDTLKIINTFDNTTIVKTGSYTYDNPARYGKKMNQINLTDIPSIVNVYNKRTDMDVDADTHTIRITNSGSVGPKIETTQQNITSFIEGANIVVSVQQVPAKYVEMDD